MAKYYTLFILSCFIWLGSGCSTKSESDKNVPPDQTIQKTSTDEALQGFESKQSFWSSVRKTLFQNNRFYSLVFTKDGPSAKIQSSLVVHSKQRLELPFSQLPSEFTLIDFDITSNGRVVQLGYKEIEGSDSEFGFPLKELSIFIDSKKAFVFSDSNQNLAVRYDKNGTPSLSQHYDNSKTYFLTSSPMTAFAKVRATDQEIYISAVGTFGFKILSFDYSGHEVSQAEMLPQTIFNTVLLDKEAPYIEVTGSRVLAAITTTREDVPIFQKHLGVHLNWIGPEYQVILQSFNLSMSDRTTQVIKGTANFFVSGIQTGGDEIAVFGSSGGPGDRRALVTSFKSDLIESYRAEFTITKESSLYAATFLKGQLLVAGSTGSSQVGSGSVVEAADSFVSSISSNGAITTLARFGTDRHDRVTSLLSVDDEVFLSGQQDGPITHTADTNPQLGYQKWFLGRLKQPN